MSEKRLIETRRLPADRMEAALRERVKELSCLYGISQVAAQDDLSLDETLQRIAQCLPPAWQYPEVASARIRLDGWSYETPGFREDGARQEAAILVNGVRRGSIEVAYSDPRPRLDEGPFLREERHLIDAVALKVALVVEQREAKEGQAKLQTQLRHAERLATIGQLAAGVAHELNEPLARILGFAQLARKSEGLPEQAARDLERIQASTLYAREIVRKLLLFARQNPPKKERVDLGRLVADGLQFLEPVCSEAGVRLVRDLQPGLPSITADPSQIQQVLVNLAVNAVQAMAAQGTLTLRTFSREGYVALSVEDTGCGMTPEVLKQIFVPFFTTKDVGKGTGLGLPVVHGIVTAHGGTIHVDSAPGRGSRFEVRLPAADPAAPPGGAGEGGAP